MSHTDRRTWHRWPFQMAICNGKRFDRNTGKTLSPATIKKIYNTMSSMFSWAVDQEMLDENPCRKVHPVKQERSNSDIVSWDAEQASAFMYALEEQKVSTQFQLYYHIALFCGMRRGEIIALRWPDIDFERKKVRVGRSVIATKGEVIEKKPKSTTSIRSVSFNDLCANLLKKWQKEQFTYRNTIANKWEGENFIFIQADGRRMYPSTPHKKFKQIIKKYNETHSVPIPEIPLHGLRHTYASLAIAEGIDVRTVSGQLGHAKTSTTTDIYAQALAQNDAKVTETLASIISAKVSECYPNITPKIN